MNDSALVVQVVETEKDLLGDLLDNVLRHTSMLISLDQAQEVLAEHLEDHAHVRSVGTGVTEVVDEADDVTSSGVRGGRIDDSLQQLNFVQGGFGVVVIRLDDFERDVPACAVSG